MRKIPHVLSGLAFLCLCLVSCDSEYDLSKEINGNIQVGAQFRLPVGATDTIYVDRVIEESETLVDNNGIYEVVSSGDANATIGPLEGVSVNGITPALRHVYLSMPSVSVAGGKYELGDIHSEGQYDINEQLPEEVTALYAVTFTDGIVPTVLNISISPFPEGVEEIALTNMVVSFPEFVKTSDGMSEFKQDYLALTAENPSAELEIGISALELSESDQSKYVVTGENGRKFLKIDDSMLVVSNCHILTNGDVAGGLLDLNFNYSTVSSVTASSISGIISTKANVGTEIDINGIPDFLRTGNTSFSPEEVDVYLDLTNPTDVPCMLSMDFMASDSKNYAEASVTFGVEPSINHILISNTDVSKPGYTTVSNPDIANLFAFVPEKISIQSDNITLASENSSQAINLEQEYEVKADYRAVIPFRFNNLNIEYTDSITDLLSDLEDVADKTDKLVVRATGVSSIGADLVASVKLYDIMDNELKGIDVNLSKFMFSAASEGDESINDLEIILTEIEGSDDLERLEKIVYTVSAVANDNMTLRPRQYLLIKDICVEIPEGINLEL